MTHGFYNGVFKTRRIGSVRRLAVVSAASSLFRSILPWNPYKYKHAPRGKQHETPRPHKRLHAAKKEEKYKGSKFHPSIKTRTSFLDS